MKQIQFADMLSWSLWQKHLVWQNSIWAEQNHFRVMTVMLITDFIVLLLSGYDVSWFMGKTSSSFAST